jgi:hypothetical protein
MRKRAEVMDDLLSGVRRTGTQPETLAPGAMLFRGFADADAPAIAEALRQVMARAPLRHMVARGGHRMFTASNRWLTETIR